MLWQFKKYGDIDVSGYQKRFSGNVDWDTALSRLRKSSFPQQHGSVDTLPLMWNIENLYASRSAQAPKTELYDEYYDPIFFDQLRHILGGAGEFIRLIFAKLPAGAHISPHTDGGESLELNKRVHIPIVTAPDVVFVVGGVAKHLKAGQVVEINNNLVHSVWNRSSVDRIHLIADWNDQV